MRIEEIPVRPKEPKITRVAAYARVSSDKDAAFHSLEAQTEYYQNYIEMCIRDSPCYFCSFLGTFTSYQGPVHGKAAKISAIVKSDFSIVLDTMP